MLYILLCILIIMFFYNLFMIRSYVNNYCVAMLCNMAALSGEFKLQIKLTNLFCHVQYAQA